MEKTGEVKKKHNCLLVHMHGDQSFVKIFDASRKLLRHSASKKTVRIQHFVEPGKYHIETDGTIEKIESVRIDLKAEEDPTITTNP